VLALALAKLSLTEDKTAPKEESVPLSD